MNRPNIDILLEKYVGKKPETKLIEKEFEKIIAYIKQRHKSLGGKLNDGDFSFNETMTSKQLTSLPEVKKIEQYTKRLFGLKECIISFRSRDIGNAATAVASNMFISKEFKEAKSGEKTNSELTICIILSSGLVTMWDLSAKELTAIYLHEVGHNFYNSIFHFLSSNTLLQLLSIPVMFLSKVPLIGPIISKMELSQAIFKMNKFFEETIFSIPGLSRLRDNLDAIVNILTSFTLMSPHALKQVVKNSWKSIGPGSIFTYNTEKHADSFAVDYGYGPELATALNKLDIDKNNIRSIAKQTPLVGWVYDLNDLILMNISSVISGYPVNSNRIRTILDRLNRSLQEPDLDPRIKKQLEEQVREMEKFYEKYYLNIAKNENQNRMFTYMYRYVAEKAFDGKMDLREFIHEIDPKKYK